MQLAQTNLQLLVQARDAGYSKSEIYDLRRDYETACLMHSHLARFNGRPFVCHLVGTASIILMEGRAKWMVRAALNHAAYDLGRFPSGARGKRVDHIRWLQSRVGEEVELYIRECNDYAVSPAIMAALARRSPNQITGRERDIVTLHVCNEVDDGADYGANLEPQHKWRSPGYINDLVTLCRHLDLPNSARAFLRIEKELEDGDWLTPSKRFSFTAHRQSPLRYMRGLLLNWAGINTSGKR